MKKRTSLIGYMNKVRKASALGFAGVLMATSLHAQNRQLNLYEFAVPGGNPIGTEDVKNYSTEVIPSANANDESVLAGTAWHVRNLVTSNAPHFMKLDASGQVVAEAYYPDKDYYDNRVKDIALDGSNNNDQSFITVWMRPPTYVPLALPDGTLYYGTPEFTNRDGIKVLRVDNNSAALMDEIVIFENSALDANEFYGNSFFPVSSMYHDNTLYICGFYVPSLYAGEHIIIAGEVNTATYHPNVSKQAFIMSIDITPGSMAYNNIMLFDYVPPANMDNVDFDMGVRMKVLDDGNIMMTGSVNAHTGTFNPGIVRSGTMAVVVRPDLSSMVSDVSFINTGNEDGYGYNEYGVDIVQKSASDIYIMANGYAYDYIYTDDDYQGLTPNPDQLLVDRVLQFSGSYGYDINRFESDYRRNWFINAVPAENTSTAGNYRFTVAGYATQDCGNAGNSPSSGNVNPILVDFEIEPPMVDLYKPNTTTTGTGVVSLFETQAGTSNYNTLGGGNSNIFLNPTFASRDDNSSLIVMNTPRYDPGWAALGIKTMHAEYNESTYPTPYVYTAGEGSGAGSTACGNSNCDINFSRTFVTSNNIAVTHPIISVQDAPSSTDEEVLANVLYGKCTWGTSNQYKTTSILSTAKRTSKFKLYPNPANTEVHVSLANTVASDAKVSVELVNMYGQSVGILYTGGATGLNANKALQLPDVATGIYMVQIIADGQMVHNEKLVIE